MHAIKKGLVRKFAALWTYIQTPENSSTAPTPCFSIMVKALVTAAHWTTANVNIYHQPWTTDKQNRFFSLESWGPIGESARFTAKFLGRPLNIGFKSKHKATGREEPCLLFLFGPSEQHKNGVARLVQPSNFVVIAGFDGYDPIDVNLVQKYKAKKDLAVGTWYKKIWSLYCTAVEPLEYKQPDPEKAGPLDLVKATPKKVQEKDDLKQQVITQKLFDKGEKKNKKTFSDSSNSSDGDAENSEEETTDVVDVIARESVGGKSPRHLATFESSKEYYRARILREKQQEKNTKKEEEANANFIRAAKEKDPDFNEDDDSLPDVSDASDLVVDTELEDEISTYAFKKYHKWKKDKEKFLSQTPKRSQSAGSVPGSAGKYEIMLVVVSTLCVLTRYLCFFCRVRQKKG